MRIPAAIRPKLSLSGYELPGGRKFYIRDSHADRDVFRQIFLDREYSFDGFQQNAEFSNFYESCENPLIVDVGANIGASAVWFALKYPKSTVIAIEPDLGNFHILRRNVEGYDRIIPINAALASSSGQLFLTNPGVGEWGYRTNVGETPSSCAVPAMTMRNILERSPSSTPFLLKIDIEGAEAEVFARPSEEFKRFPLIAIELHDWMLPGQANSSGFLRWHVAQRRDLVFRGENAFSVECNNGYN